MPEGPSLVIARELCTPFKGKKVTAVSGNSKEDILRMEGEKLLDVKTWGKHLLLCFNGFTFRIHLLLFGSYLVNERKTTALRLGLMFAKGELNFYNASVKVLEGNVNDHYDWSADVMNEQWDPEAAMEKLKKKPSSMICDTLLEQDIFAGVGNIIKNEVLYRVGIHPESLTGKIPGKLVKELIKESRIYSFEFLEWKKNYVLKQHWLVHTKKTCIRCGIPLIKKQTGKKKRRSFFCANCQKLYI